MHACIGCGLAFGDCPRHCSYSYVRDHRVCGAVPSSTLGGLKEGFASPTTCRVQRRATHVWEVEIMFTSGLTLKMNPSGALAVLEQDMEEMRGG